MAQAPAALLVLATAVFLVAAVGGESEVPEFDAYRMVEYDFRDQQLGSKKSTVSMGAVTPSAANPSRKMVVVSFEQANVALVDQLLGEKAAGGLLIVLPSPESMATLSAASAERFRAVEQSLMRRQVPVPVYFAFDGAETKKLVARLESSSGDSQLVAHGTGAASKKGLTQVSNVHGWLAGKGPKGEGIETLPVIAVVASYDSMAVAPELAVGADANGSGMIAVLQLARMFSKLYSGSRQQGRYNLIFVLTAAGKLDYAGTRYWLEQTDSRLLDRIEFAFCLDSIGKGDSIYVHTSKQPSKDKVPAVAKLFSALKTTAEEMMPVLPLEIVRKKINVSDAVAWEHEQFSRKDILAVTLSGHATHDPALRSSLLDRCARHQSLVSPKNCGEILNLGRGGGRAVAGPSPRAAARLSGRFLSKRTHNFNQAFSFSGTIREKTNSLEKHFVVKVEQAYRRGIWGWSKWCLARGYRPWRGILGIKFRKRP